MPLYALGKTVVGGPGGLADPALRLVAVLSLVSGAVVAYYGYRILRLYRIRGVELIVGSAMLLSFPSSSSALMGSKETSCFQPS